MFCLRLGIGHGEKCAWNMVHARFVLVSFALALVSTRAFSGQVGTQNTLQNGWITVQVHMEGERLGGLRIEQRKHGKTVVIPEPFILTLSEGQTLRPKEMEVVAPIAIEELAANPSASRYSEREPGKKACIELEDVKTSTYVRWCGILRDGSHYFRQEVNIHTEQSALPLTEVCLLQFKDPDAHVTGNVKGSPVTDSTMFFAFEHPLSRAKVEDGVVTAALPRELPLRKGETITYSAVVGTASPGQMRRDFLEYLERERAHPYRPFLHYNSWYDIGYGDQGHDARYGDTEALDRIRAFGSELVEKRHTVVDSFLFDDGWDDTGSTWKFNSGFPNGFTLEKEAAKKYGAGIGVWFSPWGGYDKEKNERLASGRTAGYEVVNDGFALSGPKYYARVEEVCIDMVRKYGVNFFKVDGTGNANQVFAGSEFDSDFDAVIQLVQRLRKQQPGLFINLSTGTYPSPFWLFYTDSIWRGGEDHSFTGAGSPRQRWITYRDAQTYRNIVQQGPLYPLNSLMLHGLIYAREADGLKSDPKRDFADEVHSYFGSGTQLQEMYITPSLLSEQDWNMLAETATWARQNTEILKDTHWIGGDPDRLQVYGWASWGPKKGIVVLRNPSDKPQEFALDIQAAFELPPTASHTYTASVLWKQMPAGPNQLVAGRPVHVKMEPFEVRTIDVRP